MTAGPRRPWVFFLLVYRLAPPFSGPLMAATALILVVTTRGRLAGADRAPVPAR